MLLDVFTRKTSQFRCTSIVTYIPVQSPLPRFEANMLMSNPHIYTAFSFEKLNWRCAPSICKRQPQDQHYYLPREPCELDSPSLGSVPCGWETLNLSFWRRDLRGWSSGSAKSPALYRCSPNGTYMYVVYASISNYDWAFHGSSRTWHDQARWTQHGFRRERKEGGGANKRSINTVTVEGRRCFGRARDTKVTHTLNHPLTREERNFPVT